jgi:hypothetical protein
METDSLSMDSPSEERIRPVSAGRALWSIGWKLAVLILLFYGVLQLWVRTDFFRSRVEQELSSLMGMEMRVGRIRATESLNLKIRDIISVSDVAGIEVRVARLRWRWFRPSGVPMLESLRVQGLAITIAPDADGALQPTFLGPLSRQVFDWAGVSLPAPTAVPSEKVESGEAAAAADEAVAPSALTAMGIGPLSFQDVSIRWQDAEGNLVASVTGMNVDRMSMELADGEQVAHVSCTVEKIQVERGPTLSGLRVEWVEAAGRWFLITLDALDWGTVPRPRSEADEYRELFDAMD